MGEGVALCAYTMLRRATYHAMSKSSADLHDARRLASRAESGRSRPSRYHNAVQEKVPALTCAAGLLVEGPVVVPIADGAGKGCVKLPKPPELCCMLPKLFCACGRGAACGWPPNMPKSPALEGPK